MLRLIELSTVCEESRLGIRPSTDEMLLMESCSACSGDTEENLHRFVDDRDEPCGGLELSLQRHEVDGLLVDADSTHRLVLSFQTFPDQIARFELGSGGAGANREAVDRCLPLFPEASSIEIRETRVFETDDL